MTAEQLATTIRQANDIERHERLRAEAAERVAAKRSFRQRMARITEITERAAGITDDTVDVEFGGAA